MKRLIISLLLFITVSFAQDVLTTVGGKEYKGEYMGQEARHVLFKPDGSTNSQKIPVSSLSKIQLENGTVIEFGIEVLTNKNGIEYIGSHHSTSELEINFFVKDKNKLIAFNRDIVDNVKLGDGTFLDLDVITYKLSKEELQAVDMRRQLAKLCEGNKLINVLIVPLKNDYYGLSEIIAENYDSLCYNVVENIDALEYLHKEDVSPDEINDYHLINAGQAVSANIVIYGYAYTFNVPYKYSPTTSDPLAVTTLWETDYDSPWNTLFKSLTRTMVIAGQKSERGQAISAAGSYVNLTYFTLNIDTGKKIFILKNRTVMKVG